MKANGMVINKWINMKKTEAANELSGFQFECYDNSKFILLMNLFDGLV